MDYVPIKVEKSVFAAPSYLLLDIGNSCIKYALVAGPDDHLVVNQCDSLAQLRHLIFSATKVLLACVGKRHQVEQIEAWCGEFSKPLHIAKTQAEQLGIRCAYAQYTNLGIDRWLAVLAARQITSLPVAVLDLGTANTCDVIVENQHQGGWIAPGFTLMKESLLNNTQQVFADNNQPKALNLGHSTPECVNYGCLAAVQGFIAMAEQHMATHYKDYKLMITGGAQAILPKPTPAHWLSFPNLVLMGLARFI
jgi:type III pantothenate kinase